MSRVPPHLSFPHSLLSSLSLLSPCFPSLPLDVAADTNSEALVPVNLALFKLNLFYYYNTYPEVRWHIY